MTPKRLAIACVAVGLATGPALGANDLSLLTDDNLANSATIETSGNGNSLIVRQEGAAFGLGNVVSLTIDGDLNGAGTGFAGPLLQAGLSAGTLMQSGSSNSMAFTVAGSQNLFAAAQAGNGNLLSASITGSANQVSIVQVGDNNTASVAQTGNRNTVSITQTSW